MRVIEEMKTRATYASQNDNENQTIANNQTSSRPLERKQAKSPLSLLVTYSRVLQKHMFYNEELKTSKHEHFNKVTFPGSGLGLKKRLVYRKRGYMKANKSGGDIGLGKVRNQTHRCVY